MTNETQAQLQEYNGQEVAVGDLEAQLAAQRAEAQRNSRFRSIDDGKTAQLTFTGRAYKRVSVGTNDKGEAWTADKLDWELADVVAEGDSKGRNKLFSIGARNAINRDILANIKAGRTTMFVSRKGQGTSTRYTLTTPE